MICSILNKIIDTIENYLQSNVSDEFKFLNSKHLEQTRDLIKSGVEEINKNTTAKSTEFLEYLNKNSFEDFSIDLENDFNEYFFETQCSKRVLDLLNDNSVVVILGIPGIGKTFTSKKICFEYQKKSWQILYFENINENNNVDDIIKFISDKKK